MARLVSATTPTGIGLLVTAVRHLPLLDLQARARRNAWGAMAEVRAVVRARREADAALAALAAALPAADAETVPRRAAR